MGPGAVYVDFQSDYTDGDWLFQLYAGRTLIGRTLIGGDRRIFGQLPYSPSPARLTLLRVDAAYIDTNFGDDFPDVVQASRYRLQWTASGSSADLHHWDVTGGAAAGDDPAPENILGRVPYYGDRAYSFDLPPFEGPGDWSYAVTPRDNALPLGNAGTPAEVTITANVPPPDLAFEDDEARFTATVEAGVLTVDYAWS